MGKRARDVESTPVDDAAERDLDGLEGRAMRQFSESLPRYLKEVEFAAISQERVRSLSPVISFFSIRRQEQLLKAMKKQTDAMTWHSWVMMIMTGVIVAATVTQIVLLILQKQ